MRVGIIALLQESNTFVSGRTTLEHFQQEMLLTGEAVRERLAGSHHETAGFFETLDEAGIESVPIFAARALPWGTVTGETIEHLFSLLFAELDKAGRLDGLLVAPHGATVSEPYPDVDGRWLTMLREKVGSETPIVSTLDPHANLSPAMVAACNAVVAYRTCPHIDQRARGQEAATLLVRTLNGEIRPTTAAAFPPMAINIEAQHTTESPCRELYQLADAQLQRSGVLSNSIFLGFPYADVTEMGSATLAVTDNDPQAAQQSADELAQQLWTHRQEFVGQLIGVDDALDRAADLEGPICLLDMGDNVGGGSSADGTVLAISLNERRLGPAFVCIYDPEAVQQAEASGVGNTVQMSVGGKTDDRHGPPWEDAFTVVSMHDGRFEEPEPRHGGFTTFDQGRTAVVRTETGITVMLTTRRMVPFSLQQLISCGLDPAGFRILVAKGVNAPVAAYESVCRNLVRVNTPGSTCADMTQFEFHRRRRPMFPFEAETEWKIGASN